MNATPAPRTPAPAGSGLFPTTVWSEVRRADGPRREQALESLARRYQGPAEAFLRVALGLDADGAREVFQSFFVRLLERDLLARADPGRGRFRAFLKTALRHFATDEHRRRTAARRGGGAERAPLELEPAAGTPAPEEELDRAWRAALVEEALEATRAELEASGRGEVFLVFRAYFLDPGPKVDYRALAERHGITTTDVSNRLMRAKRTFRRALRARVLDTVRDPADLEEELRWLLDGGPA